MKITIIGGGNMGSAIARGLIHNTQPFDITISDPDPDKLDDLTKEGISITDDNLAAIRNAEVIILAVKPQQVEDLCKELSGQVPPSAIVISIAAGVKIERFRKGLQHEKIVRVMPNTPAKIGMGVSGWYASGAVSDPEKVTVKDILAAFGKDVQVENEDLIDAVTAVSGCGPAYFFYFLENMVKGGVECGLPEKEAKELAIYTALGAARLAATDEDDLQTLREKVASKGGTTETALKYMEEHAVGEGIYEAVKKAFNRAKEL